MPKSVSNVYHLFVGCLLEVQFVNIIEIISSYENQITDNQFVMTIFSKYNNNKDIGKPERIQLQWLCIRWWTLKFDTSSVNALEDIDMFYWKRNKELNEIVGNKLVVIHNKCIIELPVSFIINYELEICHA